MELLIARNPDRVPRGSVCGDYAVGVEGRSMAAGERPALDRIASGEDGTASGPPQPPPSTAEVRAWARANGLAVADRGRLPPEIHRGRREAHPG